MAGNNFSVVIQDFDGKKSSSNFNIGPLTVGNFLAVRAGLNELEEAIEDVVIGGLRSTHLTESIAQGGAAVTNKFAQRGNKWIITMQDITEFFDVANTMSNDNYLNTFSTEIACADNALLPADGRDTLILSGVGADAKVTRLVAAIEAGTQSPWGGPDIKVLQIKQVNRNS